MDGRLLNEAAILERKWSNLELKNGEKVNLLDGIQDAYTRKMTAVMLENQYLVNEQSTDTSDIAQFKRISIPLVRRVYPQLIANKIVSVQPLLGPTGLVFYLRFRYSSNKGSVRGGSNTGFPGDDANSLQQDAAGNANLNIWYSSQFIDAETQTNAGGSATLVYTLEKTPVMSATVVGTAYDDTTAVATFTNASGSFVVTNVGSPSPSVSSMTLNNNTGVLTAVWSADPGANKVVVAYEYNMECNQDQPELNMAIESESITAKSRKLKAGWSFEAQQDIRSQHNLDLEQEITAVLAQEMNLEIDREILGDLRNNAGTVSTWDYGTALGDNIKEKYESLYVKVTELGNVIHRKTLRGQANWLVCSPEVASIFETATAGFAPAPTDTFTSSAGIQYVGSINSKWRIYKDPLFPINQLLMGYKGDTYMDSGYFFCPYVPLTQTPLVYEPESFCPRKGLMTRYGKILLREGAKFYARLNIANYTV